MCLFVLAYVLFGCTFMRARMFKREFPALTHAPSSAATVGREEQPPTKAFGSRVAEMVNSIAQIARHSEIKPAAPGSGGVSRALSRPQPEDRCRPRRITGSSGASRGCIGADSGRPTCALDSAVHAVPANVVLTVHRHSWDAILFVLSRSGCFEIGGPCVDRRLLLIPHFSAGAWHCHSIESVYDTHFVTWSGLPLHEAFVAPMLEGGGAAKANAFPPLPRTRPTAVRSPP